MFRTRPSVLLNPNPAWLKRTRNKMNTILAITDGGGPSPLQKKCTKVYRCVLNYLSEYKHRTSFLLMHKKAELQLLQQVQWQVGAHTNYSLHTTQTSLWFLIANKWHPDLVIWCFFITTFLHPFQLSISKESEAPMCLYRQVTLQDCVTT